MRGRERERKGREGGREEGEGRQHFYRAQAAHNHNHDKVSKLHRSNLLCALTNVNNY